MEIKQYPIESINPAEYNPRDITDKELEGLTHSLLEFGFVEPVVVNTATNRLVSGHQRIKAAKSLGIQSVPVFEVNLPEAKEKALNVALNSHTIAGKFNGEMLSGLLEEIKQELPDLHDNLRLDQLYLIALQNQYMQTKRYIQPPLAIDLQIAYNPEKEEEKQEVEEKEQIIFVKCPNCGTEIPQ